MRGCLVALALMAATHTPSGVEAAPGLSRYLVGSIQVAPGLLDFEFPLYRDLGGELTFSWITQGTFENSNPFAYLSIVSPSAAINLDAVRNVRLTVGFQELWYRAVPPVGIPRTTEERFFTRARVQQPRGSSAVYEAVELDLRNLSDPAGNHHFIFRPRFQVGYGLNLDARRVYSATLFQEVALRFFDDSYTTHAFEYYRAFVGYTFTTRRGLFVSLGFIGQLSVNPPATQLTFAYGPLLSLKFRIFPATAQPLETPPEPPSTINVQ